MGCMSAETVGMHMPAIVSLDDLAAMNAERAKMPLAWLLQTDPGDHLG
jgi:hypothetical protein